MIRRNRWPTREQEVVQLFEMPGSLTGRHVKGIEGNARQYFAQAENHSCEASIPLCLSLREFRIPKASEELWCESLRSI